MGTPTGAVVAHLKRDVVMWVGTIFVLAGMGGAVSGIADWRAARRFEREAVTAQATIVVKSLETANREENTSTRYLVGYRFAASDGSMIEQTEQLPYDDWELLAEGSTLPVRYVPGEPGTARTRPMEPWWIPPLVTSATTLFAIVGALIAATGWRRALMIWRLHRGGSSAVGTIVEVAPTNVRINRVPQWRLRYEFSDTVGRSIQAESGLLGPGEAAEWQVGDRGNVLYDGERPNDSLWVGRA
jgi:hypothetical protein